MARDLTAGEQNTAFFESMQGHVVDSWKYSQAAVPGLLQSDGYTAAVMGSTINLHSTRENERSPYDNGFLERSSRLARQEANGGTASIIIGETALNQRYGQAADMVNTIHNALIVARSGRHSVRVLPFNLDPDGQLPLPNIPNHLVEDIILDGIPMTVAWEDDGCSIVLPTAPEIALYQAHHIALGHAALDQAASIELMEGYEEKWAEQAAGRPV